MKDSNRLIAEFMGHKLGLDGDGKGEPQSSIFENGLGTKRIEDTYNKSWDWLMPVVERIENLGFEFFIVGSRCKVAHNSDNSISTILDSEGKSTKLNHTYSVVVEFITIHNEEN